MISSQIKLLLLLLLCLSMTTCTNTKKTSSTTTKGKEIVKVDNSESKQINKEQENVTSKQKERIDPRNPQTYRKKNEPFHASDPGTAERDQNQMRKNMERRGLFFARKYCSCDKQKTPSAISECQQNIEQEYQKMYQGIPSAAQEILQAYYRKGVKDCP